MKLAAGIFLTFPVHRGVARPKWHVQSQLSLKFLGIFKWDLRNASTISRSLLFYKIITICWPIMTQLVVKDGLHTAYIVRPCGFILSKKDKPNRRVDSHFTALLRNLESPSALPWNVLGSFSVSPAAPFSAKKMFADLSPSWRCSTIGNAKQRELLPFSYPSLKVWERAASECTRRGFLSLKVWGRVASRCTRCVKNSDALGRLKPHATRIFYLF